MVVAAYILNFPSGVEPRPSGNVKGVSNVAENFANAKFMTVTEVADMMRVSRMTVYRMIHAGELPAVRFGRSYRVPLEAVQSIVADTDAATGTDE